MSHPPFDSTEIARRLLLLSKRQCQILYWFCHGQSQKEIGKEIGYKQDLVQKEMSAIYRLFELTDLSREDKRRLLEKTICPINETLMTNPATDCSQRPIAVNEPEPDPKALAEVKKDEESGLVLTPTRSLVRVSPQHDYGSYPPPPRHDPPGEIVIPPPVREPPIPFLKLAVVALGALVILMSCAILVLIARQSSPIQQPSVAAVVESAIPTRIARAVVPTLPSVAPLATIPPSPTLASAQLVQVDRPMTILAVGSDSSAFRTYYKNVSFTLVSVERTIQNSVIWHFSLWNHNSSDYFGLTNGNQSYMVSAGGTKYTVLPWNEVDASAGERKDFEIAFAAPGTLGTTYKLFLFTYVVTGPAFSNTNISWQPIEVTVP